MSESIGFELSRNKTEYLEWKFSEELHEEGVEVQLDTQAAIPQATVSNILALLSRVMGTSMEMFLILLVRRG